MEVSQTSPVKNIFQRMIEVQKKVQSVYKDETIKLHENDKGYKAVSHDDVAALLHIPLAEAGIVLLPDVIKSSTSTQDIVDRYGKQKKQYRTDLEIKVKWINADDPKDFFESSGGSFALDSSDKSYAKAYSLALKIVLLKVHLLESRDREEERPFDDVETAIQELPPRQGGSKPAPKPSGRKFDEMPNLKITMEDAANYQIRIPGSQFLGKALRDIPRETLSEYAQFIDENRPNEGAFKEFLDHAEVSLGLKK